ncbi:MAG: DNA gyrase subunit A [Deltaproteobacteria bacterium]|nr:DNA gyrase subunit A [Deltaproteobacteria bacterium]
MTFVSQELPINIEDEITRSYMDYAMSVIIGRALPDIRDGLKPVHRRILYSMRELGNDYNKAYKKSARIVGDVIGKYHPHGDTAVYDTIVRMAQDFSLRYPLVDGQGNFGSVDGDSPAAMRYTEIRMTRLAHEFLEDLDKETVEFIPNYDGSLKEPTILPAMVPNLLINGSSGIAVGMATNIPPHNLSEVIDGLLALIDNPDLSFKDLIHLIPGPDFPTAGFIYGSGGIYQAYQTGRGIIKLRARVLVEKKKAQGRESIVVTELPYQVNKARLIEKIAELVKEKRIEGIQDVRDESDREGMRIVIDLKKDEVVEIILNQLYKFTSMEVTFGIIFLAIVNNRPKVMDLKTILVHFLDFRKEIIRKRTAFELKEAERKAHILEGLKIALDHLDEVIALIRKAKNPAEAKSQLISRFSFSEIQAQSILEMRLQRLTNLEREKIIQDYKEILKTIERLKSILASEALILQLIREELTELKKRYGDERRTEIIEDTTEIQLEDLIVEEDMAVTISHGGYIKRNPISLYRSQRRGGRGITGMETKEDDFVEHLFIASTHNYFLFFTNLGRLYWLKVHEIPQAGRLARGKAMVNVLNLQPQEKVATTLPIRSFEEGKSIIMVTRKGMIKKTDLMSFSRPRSGGIIATIIQDGDELIAANITHGEQDIFLGTRDGLSIRFKEKDIREMGRMAQGVKGIRLSPADWVVGAEVLSQEGTILTVTENGFGKRTRTEEYREQGRAGKGIITIKTTDRNGPVVGVLQVTDEDDLMIITDRGKIIRLRIKDISVIGRNTQGVRLINLEDQEKVVSVARSAAREEEKDVPE